MANIKTEQQKIESEKSANSDQPLDCTSEKQAYTPQTYTPIDITDEEWIAATQACCGIGDILEQKKKLKQDKN